MKSNLFEGIPDALPEELISVLAQNDKAKVERIVSDGHASPPDFWYDQEQDEWVMLLAGSAMLSMETDAGIKPVELNPGDCLLIPAHQRHRVESTSQTEKTIWLAVFLNHPLR